MFASWLENISYERPLSDGFPPQEGLPASYV